MLRFSLLLVALLAAMARPVHAQRSSLSEWYSLSLGGTSLELVGVSAGYNFARRNAYHFSAQYDSPLLGGQRRSAAFNAGVGQHIADEYVLIAAFVGPSLAYSRAVGEGGNMEHTYSPSVFGGVQMYVKPLAFLIPELGLGIELMGNANTRRSFYGIRFALLMSNAR